MQQFTLSTTRLSSLVQSWASTTDSIGRQCSALVFVFGDITPNTYQNQRGQAVLQYLLNANMPVANVASIITKESAIIFHDGNINVQIPEMSKYKIEVVSSLNEGNGKGAILDALSDKVAAAALKEFSIQEGSFATTFMSVVKESAAGSDKLVEAAQFFGELLFVKDTGALESIEKAAGLCKAVFRRYARRQIEDQLSSASPKMLLELRESLCQTLEHPNTIEGLEALDTSAFSLATLLTPCIFHKGTYIADMQVDANQLRDATSVATRGDVIVVRFGAKNNSNAAFMARTLIVESNAPSNVKEAYDFVYDVSEEVIKLLRPGAVLKDIYSQVVEFANTRNAYFSQYLGKSFGFSTGLLVLEPRGSIAEKGVAVVQDDMSFVVRVFLDEVPDEGENPSGTYAVELADTVIVKDGAAILQTKVARRLDEILYQNMDGEEAGDSDDKRAGRDLTKITRQGASDTVIVSREAQRETELRRLLAELRAEFAAVGGKKVAQSPSEELYAQEIGKLSRGDINPFLKDDQVPPDGARKGIFVQSDKKVVWFPICGSSTSFHISTISKVDVKTEGDAYTMTVVFHSLQESNVAYKLNRTKVFVKELNYRCSKDVFTDVQVAIQSVLQRIRNEDAARKRSMTATGTSRLIIGTPEARLMNVKLRPPIAVGRQSKGCVGNLELHENGLRFSFLGGTPVDILFDNIKNVIFQPSQHTIYVIYHITLKKPMELGRKAATELQFVAEVMESSEAATGARRTYEEEVLAEERDQMRINEINKIFKGFAASVEKKSGSLIKTQLPMRNFSFDGVHTRSATTFKGSREVLWAVSDWPAFTYRVDEIEVVFLERVIAGGSTIDVSLVPKDYSKPVATINAIPSAQLDAIKDWCLVAGVYYVEAGVNINWREIMKNIAADPEWNPWDEEEGWALMNGGDNDEEDSGSEMSDSTYNEEEDEESSDDDDSSWLEDDEESDEDSSDDGSGDDDESSALSWDELDRRAVEQDRKRTYSDDDEGGAARKRPRTAAPPRLPAAPQPRQAKAPIQYGKSVVPPPRRF